MADRTPNPSGADPIEVEAQRRVARATQPLYAEIADLRNLVGQCQTDLVRQHSIITRLTGEALCFGTLIQVHNSVDPRKYRHNDEVLVTDESSPHFMKGGRIVSGAGTDPVVDCEGHTFVKLADGSEARFAVGAAGKAPAQIRLTQKDDGTYAVVSVDGKPWEVRGVPDLNLQVGDAVKVKPDTKAIVAKGYDLGAGPICNVVAVLDDCVEVMHKGDKSLVYNPRGLKLEEGERIACDPGMFSIVRKLPADARDKYKVTSDLTMTWDDIGGLDGAKQELRDALELPYQQPELFKHYGIEPLRGVLLYGPPGCGKTLLARVAAWAMANVHGKKATDTGYIYVKSPEILNKWVGNSEQELRDLFERARRHYREFGYKAILAFDEADAIFPQRGTRLTSGIADTMVPMVLGEMDGIDSRQTEENPIVVLLTNRADSLDPAVTRPGRISRHIKIERPNEMSAIDVLGIHTRKIPFADPASRDVTLAVCASDVFGKTRLLYRVNNEFDFTMGDCVNGAMLENIAQMAKMNALHRDLTTKTTTGVTLEDFRAAVQKTFRQLRGTNHSYDLQDFAEKMGIQPQSMQVERCFGAA